MDTQRLALSLGRGRAVIGLALVIAPGLVGRLWLGSGAGGAQARALIRMMGIRDVVLAVGTLTSVKEHTQGPEWLGMGAIADGVDALVCAFAPGIPKRGRLVALVAAGASITAMKVARDLADERDTRTAQAAHAGRSEVDS